jgi:hypothetical protein
MTSDTLQTARRELPFRPFVIHMADGREIPVAHPEVLAYQEGTRTAVVMDGDSFEFIDLLLATGLDYRGVERMTAAVGNQGGA